MSISQSTEAGLKAAPKRFWFMRLFSMMLLLLQATGFIGAVRYYIDQIPNSDPFLAAAQFNRLSEQSVDLLWFVGVFTPLGGGVIFAALCFILWPRTAWLVAMLGQGFILYTGLTFYFTRPLDAIYPIMLYAIFMVLYLNSAAVQRALLPKSTPAKLDTIYDTHH